LKPDARASALVTVVSDPGAQGGATARSTTKTGRDLRASGGIAARPR
jgi:hypothetical protein